MGTPLSKKLDQISEPRQRQVRSRAAQLIAEEMSLRDLHVARKLTQEKLAELLHIWQESVSRLEKRSDLHLSTLKEFVSAMGGDLRLVGGFPDRPPVIISGF